MDRLMEGMAEVGRLFNNNELIVAEVLQSAEVMKAPLPIWSHSWRRMRLRLKGKIILGYG